MRILAIETSTRHGGVALFDGETVVSAASMPTDQRSTQSLLVVLREQLLEAKWAPNTIELVATTHGPGSFTGLRVGVTAAKTFAYSTSAKLIGVNTLEIIAAQSAGINSVHVVLDAQRGQLFRATYDTSKQGSSPRPTSPTEIVSVDGWLSGLAAHDTVSGLGLTKLRSRLPKDVIAVDEQLWTPSASTVATVAFQHYNQGERHDVWSLVPQYFRKSAAEEKADSGT